MNWILIITIGCGVSFYFVERRLQKLERRIKELEGDRVEK